MRGILAVPLDPFLNLRANLLVTSHPKKLCCKLIDHKNYFLCGTWSCRSNSVKSVVTLSSFMENHMALTGRWSSKPWNKHQCASLPHCFYFLIHFISWLHVTYKLLGKGPCSHSGSVCFSEDVLMQLSQPFHLHLAPFPQMTSHPKHRRDFKPPWSKGGGWKKTWCRWMSHLCHWLKHCCQDTLFSI